MDPVGWDILGDSSHWCFFYWLFNRDPGNITKSTHNWVVSSPLYTKELDSEFVSCFFSALPGIACSFHLVRSMRNLAKTRKMRLWWWLNGSSRN